MDQTEKQTLKQTTIVRLKPYILTIIYSLLYAGYNIIAKLSLDKGMNRYVLVAYGYAFGFLATAVLALVCERKNDSRLNGLTLPICFQIFVLGLIGVVGRIFFYAGLQCTSPTFVAAMNNLVPSVTFLLAILCRMEKVSLLELSGQAKVGGTIIAFGGATLMTLYKGISVISGHNHHYSSSKKFLDGNLVKGSIFLILQSLAASSFYVLQTATIKKYPAPLTLTSLSALFGTIIGTIVAAILDHKSSSWKLSFNISLVAPIYSGVLMFGVSTYIVTLVLKTRGPVFVSAFRPLVTVIVAVMGFFILGETLYLGGIFGAVMIIIGLYAILWAKEYEKNARNNKEADALCNNETIEIKQSGT